MQVSCLWHGLRRLMILLYQRERTNALLMIASSFLLLWLPFIMLPFPVLFSIHTSNHFFMDGCYHYSDSINNFLLILDMITITVLFLTSVIQSSYTLFQNSPVCPRFSFSWCNHLLHLYHQFLMPLKNAIDWKDRQ